jgi:hypothetical protein
VSYVSLSSQVSSLWMLSKYFSLSRFIMVILFQLVDFFFVPWH